MVLALEKVEPLHLRCQDPHSERHPGTSVFLSTSEFSPLQLSGAFSLLLTLQEPRSTQVQPQLRVYLPSCWPLLQVLGQKSIFTKRSFFSAKFGLFDEIQAAGYHHGTTFFYGLKKAGRSGGKSGGADDSHSWLPTADRAKKAIRSFSFFSPNFVTLLFALK